MTQLEELEKITKQFQNKVTKLLNNQSGRTIVSLYVWKADQLLEDCKDNPKVTKKEFPDAGWYWFGDNLDPVQITIYIPK